MISSGKRDRRVDILQRNETVGAAGDRVVTYTPRMRVWAFVAGRTGRERFAADQEFQPWDMRINVRYNANIKTTDKIVFGGERYDIAFLTEVGRREELEILAVKDIQ